MTGTPTTRAAPAGRTLRMPADLAAEGLVPANRIAELESVAARYAVAVTPAMVALIDPADPADPIAAQFLPDPRELVSLPDEAADPVGDHAFSPVPGIVHRYPDRVLLKITHTCAVYCRFCFRREMVGPDGDGDLSGATLDAALRYIAETPRVWEVIVTGGDPLVLSARRLSDLSARLAAIPHVRIVRYHTRIPVVAPERITAELVAALTCADKAAYVSLHANHPRELTAEARSACARIIDAGLPMLSQTVLLKGVNDTPEVMGDLMRAFVETRIKPYYLHHPDKAPGTGWLRTDFETGRALMRALRGDLSGLCQPTYIFDIPGGHGKAPVGPDYLSGATAENRRIEDPWGQVHDLDAHPGSENTREIDPILRRTNFY
jgi:lysine 2,3-aminomutase